MTADFLEVCASSELPERGKRSVPHGRWVIALVRLGGQVFAIDNRCPHRDGELAQGDLQGVHLFCPLHAWSFDVRTGLAFFPRGARVDTFATREEGGAIWVAAAPRLP
jgi:nitrite reductase (NADH) small subunit